MEFTLKVNGVESIDEIPGYWTNDDYINILEGLDFSDARTSNPSELRELVEMAMSDFKPPEAAAILLKYKLKEELTDGQIQNISHEMVDSNEAKGNTDISLHYVLFNINRLLYAAFNGIFPNKKATKVEFTLNFKEDSKIAVTKELALRAVCSGLSGNNLILRLFESQLHGEEDFSDAEKIVWELHNSEENKYTLITSDHWINEEDFIEREVSSSFKIYEEREG
ncbi:hypothetical protein JWG39_08305 [Desulforhopalus vacuolatus]|uniref:hypothetical protein n=1 Tax=Desulforhopalus vacuolatus TaxID=40414 RepID=UPI0019642F15|nr:hypothetical protein [Desulforhopalus vacuolatus]MBM9519818.1 hypothetical protein [Desulforhopalus vacuolatus]